MKTIQNFANYLNADVRKVRYTFRGIFIGYGFDIVVKGIPGKMYKFEPNRDTKGKYWTISGHNKIAFFVKHARSKHMRLKNLITLHNNPTKFPLFK